MFEICHHVFFGWQAWGIWGIWGLERRFAWRALHFLIGRAGMAFSALAETWNAVSEASFNIFMAGALFSELGDIFERVKGLVLSSRCQIWKTDDLALQVLYFGCLGFFLHGKRSAVLCWHQKKRCPKPRQKIDFDIFNLQCLSPCARNSLWKSNMYSRNPLVTQRMFSRSRCGAVRILILLVQISRHFGCRIALLLSRCQFISCLFEILDLGKEILWFYDRSLWISRVHNIWQSWPREDAVKILSEVLAHPCRKKFQEV